MPRLLTTPSRSYLEMVKLALEAEGIPFVATNELSPGLGVPFTLSVQPEDLERAQEILRELEQDG